MSKNIPLYWWEGYYGFDNCLRRVVRGRHPYIKNFGDLLSPLIISLLAEDRVRHSIAPGKLLALGSVFFALKDNDSVWGSGFLNAKHIHFALKNRNVNYFAVRGPETRRLLLQNNINCPEVYGDPAIILPQLITNDVNKKYKVGLVPHFSHLAYFKKNIKDNTIQVIDVEAGVANVVRDILSCEVIISTSLHGIIVAEAYGIPALMLTLQKPDADDLFKYEDYYHSTNRELMFVIADVSRIAAQCDLALKMAIPQYDREGLLAAFPLARTQGKIFSWSSIKTSKIRSSILPPYFQLPV